MPNFDDAFLDRVFLSGFRLRRFTGWSAAALEAHVAIDDPEVRTDVFGTVIARRERGDQRSAAEGGRGWIVRRLDDSKPYEAPGNAVPVHPDNISRPFPSFTPGG